MSKNCNFKLKNKSILFTVLFLGINLVVQDTSGMFEEVKEYVNKFFSDSSQIESRAQVIDCPICFEGFDTLCKLDCGHEICSDCLNQMLNVSLKDSNTKTLHCFDALCKKDFTFKDLQKTRNNGQRLDRFREIKYREWQDKLGITPKASKASSASVAADKQSEEDRQSEEWKRLNAKECPKCKSPIQKIYGCNHMTCGKSSCKHQFCWICMSNWESSHYKCTLNNPASNDPVLNFSVRGFVCGCFALFSMYITPKVVSAYCDLQ